MQDIVIKAENLGKKYVIGHQTERVRYLALRDVWMQNARTLWNKTKDLAKGKPVIQGDTLEEVWALQDVSFEIRRGEAVGISGHVASLLEVGSGFHPELSGQENIYLNGTILGMTRYRMQWETDSSKKICSPCKQV